MNKQQHQSTTIRVPKDQLEELGKYADKLGISRNKLINNLLETGIDDLRLMEKSGLLVFGRGVRDLVAKLRIGSTQKELEF